MFKNKKNNLHLLKKTLIPIILIAMIVVVIVIAINFYNPFERIDYYSLEEPSQIEKAYNDGITNVTITIDELKNLGYDYKINGEKAGTYYYSYDDGKFLIVLIDCVDEVVYNYHVRGIIKEDLTVYSYIKSSLADALETEKDEVGFVTYDYIISEIDY